METEQQASCLVAAARFLREYWLRFTLISFALWVPCFWHRRIEAGDLGSHAYNAWLAQLIEKGQAPGLYFARQWNNVVFDVLLLKFGNAFGLAVAQKIAVAVCVLIFFWVVFALLAAVANPAPWFLLPCVAMLAYGWTFNIGFFNYYLSLGLGFLLLAILWRKRAARSANTDVALALLFGIACFAIDRVGRRGERESWVPLRLPLELHWVVVFATYVLPDVLRVPLYSGWVGALALRLTTVSAALGLCVLAFMQPRKWHTIGFAVIAIVFFAFLYQDTATLNRMEAQIERLVASLPRGESVTATIWAPPDSRLAFIHHMVDRACIAKCFSFENYEPASRQFRVRVNKGSPVATDDSDASQEMEAGEYVVQPSDLPMAQVYQCNDADLTQLCIRQLAAGEANGRLGYH